MKNPVAKKVVLWAMVAGVYALICYLSFQTGEETTALSESLARLLKNFVGMSAAQALVFAQGLRKAAHMIEFAALTAVLYPAVCQTAPRSRMLWIVSITLCIALAVCSETFKVSIPGRHLDFGEMAMNVVGCGVGLLLGVCVSWCRNVMRKSQKR